MTALNAAADEAARLVRLAVTTAVQLLESQDGLLFPIAHAVASDGRTTFIGTYSGGTILQPVQALIAIRAALRKQPYRSTAVTFGIAFAHECGRSALCVEFESLDAAPETILVPFIITRPRMRRARVVTYAPIREPGRNHVLRAGSAAGADAPAGTQAHERTPLREKE